MSDIPEGLCQCGCGEKTRLETVQAANRGLIRGKPRRFVYGHGARKRTLYLEEDRGYKTPCWIWQLALYPDGYGQKYVGTGRDDRKTVRAHRWMYEQHRGPFPKELSLDHLCRVPKCINPDHLEPVTHRENIQRGKTSTLTPNQVRTIRWLWTIGLGPTQLGKLFGVHMVTIGKITGFRTWKNV